MHHAYYIEGPLSSFEAYKEQLKPFWAIQIEKFGIDDARELVERAQLKTVGESVFLVAVGSITSEAQQALLKLFEEPQPGLMFVLLMPHGTLLPTLRSRMLPFSPQQLSSQKVLGSPRPADRLAALPQARPDLIVQKAAATFIKASQKDRSTQITAMLKDDEGVREQVRGFLNALESALLPRIKDKKVQEALADIAKVRSYVGDRSPSLKMLLEHLAVSVPQV